MSAYTDRQAHFSWMLGELLTYAGTLEGHRVRISWAYRSPEANRMIGGHPRSLHCDRLAIDLVLDILEGDRWVYQRSSKPYLPLGEYWEALGGAWGGRFKRKDGGHFSLEWEGMK